VGGGDDIVSRRYRVLHHADELTADVLGDGLVIIDGRRFHVVPAGPGHCRVTSDDGATTLVAVAGPGRESGGSANGITRTLELDAAPRRAGTTRSDAADMTAPMPATVVRVAVAVGDRVAAGAPVVVLEAMKMELTVRAARAGVVTAIACQAGDLVTPGVRLVEIG